MLLGQIIRNFTDESNVAEVLIGFGDLTLVARIEQACRPRQETSSAYAAGAVARFADHAGDEDWLALMNKIARTDDPAGACLRTMIEWSLRQEADATHSDCSCGQTH